MNTSNCDCVCHRECSCKCKCNTVKNNAKYVPSTVRFYDQSVASDEKYKIAENKYNRAKKIAENKPNEYSSPYFSAKKGREGRE